MNYSVIIVTYNRLTLLKECIDHVLNQTIKPSHVIIVNNASTDGTKEYLDSLNSPLIIIRYLNENTGGAGGFYEGLKISSEQSDEWSVIIDDDAILRPDFMAQMQKCSNAHPDVAALAGAVYQNGQIEPTHRQTMKRPGFLSTPISAEHYEKSSFSCDFASFCGLVIRNDLLKTIGLPEKDYFIWYDDTEYCIRIRSHSKILVVPAAILDHKVAVPVIEKPRRYTWKDYYGIRNRLHMVRKHGNVLDLLFVKLHVFFNVGVRNFLFSMIHLQGYDWKFEQETLKKARKADRMRNK